MPLHIQFFSLIETPRPSLLNKFFAVDKIIQAKIVLWMS